MRLPVSLALFATLASCGYRQPKSTSDADNAPTITLRVAPAASTVMTKDMESPTLPYTVFAISNGAEQDVTAQTTFGIDPGFGQFAGNVLQISSTAIGKTTVAVAVGAQTATAELIVKRDTTRLDASAPANAAQLFDGAVLDSASQVAVVYPADQVVVPRNLGDLDVHWQRSGTDSAYAVTLRNEYGSVRVLLGSTAALNAFRFLPDEWATLSQVGTALQLEVRGLDPAQPTTYRTSATRKLTASDRDMIGAIYYWGTGARSTGSLLRHDMADVGTTAEEFLRLTGAGECIGCHALTRDGKRMLVRFNSDAAQFSASAAIYDVATKTKLVDIPNDDHDLYTYHPNGNVLFVQRGSMLRALDGTTAALLGETPLPSDAVQPDFSPKGDRIVYIEGTSLGTRGHHVIRTPGRIVYRMYDDTTHTFGPAVPIFAPGDLVYYPIVSPDGEWVVFNRAATGSSRTNTDGELWAVKMDGTHAQKLGIASQGAGLANTWPRWAPFEQTVNGEKVFWLTFSTSRPFGIYPMTVETEQIWMTSFSPARAARDEDPSSPAFRLPFQSLTLGNHIGQWTEIAVQVE